MERPARPLVAVNSRMASEPLVGEYVVMNVRQSMPRASWRRPRGRRWPNRARKGSSVNVREVASALAEGRFPLYVIVVELL